MVHNVSHTATEYLPSEGVKCSFCGKSADDVEYVLAGPNNIYICDECIVLGSEIITWERTNNG